jgi:putative membrane protein
MAGATGVRAWLAVYVKGLCMGAADTVPGVSGGTIAVIVGVYERLITALTSLDPLAIRHLRSVHTAEGRSDLARDLVRMDVPFLLVLGAGVLTAAASLATVMHVAIERHPAPTYAFFFGLIGASAVVLYRYVDAATPRRALVAIGGFLLAFVVTDPALAGSMETTLPVLFVSGAIAISAMVLPGISGSFLLLVLGQYTYVSGIPKRIVTGVLELPEGNATTLIEALAPFATFLAGAIVGVFTVAYAVRAALDRYREATLTFLVSLMVGALRLPATEVRNGVDGVTVGAVGLVAIPAVVGAFAVFALDYYTDDLEY